MRLGVHIRIAGGILKGLDTAAELGCETIQLFASNPNSWRFTRTDPVEAQAFRERCSRMNIHPVALHTAYLLNLASPDDANWTRSLDALTMSLDRAGALGAAYVVTHIGSHGGAGYSNGVERIVRAVRRAILDAEGPSMVLLESGSGAGNSVGSRFEDLRDILGGLTDVSERVGVCLDTAHLYGAGYDISSNQGVYAVFDEFHRTVGLDRLKFLHLNDTQKALGSKADRHWHVGQGNVGLEGFRSILNHPMLSTLAGIIETPGKEEGEDEHNLGRLRGLRTED